MSDRQGDVRSVMISGEAVKAMSGGMTRKRAPRQKKAQDGGTLNGVSVTMMGVKGVESAATMNAASPQPATWLKTPDLVPPRTNIVVDRFPVNPHHVAAPTPAYRFQGGQDTKQIKVELKKKGTVKKVKLHPKKVEAVKASVAKSQTRKSRKLTLGVASLHKRMLRAKKVQRTMKAMPLDTLKKLLIQKKLIKSTSKAPESILRQIAVDSHIVEGKSL